MQNAAVELHSALSYETQRNLKSVLSVGVNMGFTQPLVLLSSFILSRNVATICLLECVDGSRSRLD